MASFINLITSKNQIEILAENLEKKFDQATLKTLSGLIEKYGKVSAATAEEKMTEMQGNYYNQIGRQIAVFSSNSKVLPLISSRMIEKNKTDLIQFNDQIKRLRDFAEKTNVIAVQRLFYSDKKGYDRQMNDLSKSKETIRVLRFLAEVSKNPAAVQQDASSKHRPKLGSSENRIGDAISNEVL